MLRITPQGKRKEVMALPAKGHIVVLRTAGSGKTTIALLRAHHLANIPNGGRVLQRFNRRFISILKILDFSIQFLYFVTQGFA